jgi:chromate transporter
VLRAGARLERAPGQDLAQGLEIGLAPVGTGLILAGAIAVLRLTGASAASWIVAAVAALILGAWPRVHPFLLLAGGGALFALYRLAAG